MDAKKITLYRGWRDPGKHVWSPFVVKMEVRLRIAGVPYTTEAGSARTAPKGKIPYLELRSGEAETPEAMADSTLMIANLCERGIVPDLNARLSILEKSHDLALRALLEDKLYFYHTWERWTQNYYTMREHILWAVPWPMRVLVGNMIYRKTCATLHGQGTGRYDAVEIAAFRRQIWDSVNGLLAASKAASSAKDPGAPFWALGGGEPTEADMTLFGFVVSVLVSTACPDSQSVVRGYPVIVEYASRIHDRFFPDYAKWGTKSDDVY